MRAELRSGHLAVRIDLEYILSPFPFPLIFFVDKNLLLGTCWDGKLEGIGTNISGFFEELLIACSQILNPEESTSNFARKEATWWGFPLKEGNPAYGIITPSEPSSIYYLEAEGNILKIHYYNELLSYTDCPEFRGRHRGVVEVPLREFVEDVLKISREFLTKYAPIVEKVRLEHREKPEDYDYLWRLYHEVKELYEKKFNGQEG
ncbi:hypothetical protein [Thermococcus sp. MV11]|uniref:hypothetical protein n=1 Tax=Thermococcus sp. MV11 TaxID=1638267 RepID=UPI001430CCB5|nr:hypothetical protein [Thermococcus sp. MV11]NJE04136.1 hypothetical protein [Thermococcus sp. MV11]